MLNVGRLSVNALFITLATLITYSFMDIGLTFTLSAVPNLLLINFKSVILIILLYVMICRAKIPSFHCLQGLPGEGGVPGAVGPRVSFSDKFQNINTSGSA